jgi:hypothetical protein
MCNALSKELPSIILGLIQTNDSLDVPLFEDVTVFFGSKSGSLPWFTSVQRPHECSEFTWNDPIDIAIVYSLVVLVLLDIEGLEVVPFMSDTLFETLKAVKHGALVVAFALGGVAEWHKLVVVRLESLVRLLRAHLQYDHHEGAHEEGRIRQLIRAI